MAAQDPKKPAATPAPTQAPRQRTTIDDVNSGAVRKGTPDEKRDPENMAPGGADPRATTVHAGKYSTAENVTTEEQEAAQAAARDPEGPQSLGPGTAQAQADQIESQKAAAENPLAPVSTIVNPNREGMGLLNPPAPEGYVGVPQPTLVRDAQGNLVGADADAKTRTEASNASAKRQRKVLEEAKVKVKLRGGLTLTDDFGRSHTYEAGEQEMPESHANHWYVQQHIVPDEK